MDFDPMAVAGFEPEDTSGMTSYGAGHNSGDASTMEDEARRDSLMKEIGDLFEEAEGWADGESVANDKQAEAVDKLVKMLTTAGGELEKLRKKEAKVFDDGKAAVQAMYNPFIQAKKGKVDMAKTALLKTVEDYRRKKAAEAEAEAQRIKDEAAARLREAQANIRESGGNLIARARAEEELSDAKNFQAQANKVAVDLGKGHGLTTVTGVEIDDVGKAIDWAFDRDPEAFENLALSMARQVIARNPLAQVPGFKITKRKVARA